MWLKKAKTLNTQAVIFIKMCINPRLGIAYETLSQKDKEGLCKVLKISVGESKKSPSEGDFADWRWYGYAVASTGVTDSFCLLRLGVGSGAGDVCAALELTTG